MGYGGAEVWTRYSKSDPCRLREHAPGEPVETCEWAADSVPTRFVLNSDSEQSQETLRDEPLS